MESGVIRQTMQQPDLDKLDDTQKLAVGSIIEEGDSKVVIKAPAGSGKTKTLTTAVGNYRYEYIDDYICAITFTRAAKAEMEERLRAMGVYDVEVATIHAWASRRLEKLSKKHGFGIRILQEPDIKKILKDEIAPKYLLTHKSIRTINVDILYLFIAGNKNMDVSDNYKRTLAALEARYIDFKKKNELYDFTDYPRYLLDVLKGYDEYIEDIDALFVDEFQDVDPDQFEVFTRVLAKKKFYIGDLRQSIYMFRSADGEAFNKLEGFTEYNLHYNYRSYQEIIDYATTIYEDYKPLVDIDSLFIAMTTEAKHTDLVECHRGYGGDVYIINTCDETNRRCRHLHNGKSEPVNGLKTIKDFLALKPMVLCRSNREVKELQACGLNATTIHQAKGLEYQNVIVVDFKITSGEELNIAYVGLTRAEDKLMVVSFENLLTAIKVNPRRALI